MIERDKNNNRLCGYTTKTNVETLTEIKCSYMQEGDTCSDADNSIEISALPEGYFVIKTERFAFETIEEVQDLFRDFLSRFTFEFNADKQGNNQ